MPLSPEATEAVQSELKRFAADLNLSEDQKTRLKTALESAREKLDEIRKNNPDITKADVIAKLKEARAPLRERVVAFLTAGAADEVGRRSCQGQGIPGLLRIGRPLILGGLARRGLARPPSARQSCGPWVLRSSGCCALDLLFDSFQASLKLPLVCWV